MIPKEPITSNELIKEAFILFKSDRFHEADKLCKLAITEKKSSDYSGLGKVLNLRGKIACKTKNFGDAVRYFSDALSHDNHNFEYRDNLGKLLLKLGNLSEEELNLDGAKEIYRFALKLNPLCNQAAQALVNLQLQGESYLEVLSRLHNFFQPETYVEIGVSFGSSLAKVSQKTFAVGIDPISSVKHKIKAKTKFFQMTSDDFFRDCDLTNILSGRKIEMTFLDGLHTFEQILKDFLNIERYSSPETIVAVHDCLPIDPIVASPHRTTNFWTGDVWKLLPALRAYRPNLKIFVIPTPPSGLAIIKNLNPAEGPNLKKNYKKMFSSFKSLSFEDFEYVRDHSFKIIPNNWSSIKKQIISL